MCDFLNHPPSKRPSSIERLLFLSDNDHEFRGGSNLVAPAIDPKQVIVTFWNPL